METPVSLMGTGVVQAAVSPTSLSVVGFPGKTSSPAAVTLTNNLPTALTIASITFTGANAAYFSSPSNTCGGSLAANAQCTINVQSTSPPKGSVYTATLNVNDSANNSPQTVLLSGSTPTTSLQLTLNGGTDGMLQACLSSNLNGAPYPTGSVAFSVNGMPIGTVSLGGDGNCGDMEGAFCTIDAGVSGLGTYTATYPGDGNFTGSSGSLTSACYAYCDYYSSCNPPVRRR